MRATPILPLLFALVVTTFSYMSDARSLCTPCFTEEECDKEPEHFCMWGVARDSCNKKVCAKGPGERCGGPLGVLGQCGAGMMCYSDEICHGCSSKTFECYP
ncbi:hypothetical protein ILUMI_07486 [Ignelater luminosus]|uniref:Neuroparsin n=1 Tax=Ignelater luminosus TaxID=2038154 RepID=A0A8K0D3E0_IGNLU|nr:hypothetical protein ILUMI_07486 [Ignelater luminosus]